MTDFRAWWHYHGPRVLNGRVRDGNGCGRPGLLTGKVPGNGGKALRDLASCPPRAPAPSAAAAGGGIGAAKRSAVSTGQLRRLPVLHTRPIDLVVFQEPVHPKVPEASSCGGFHA